jgi:hypothetical protein
MRRQFRFAVVVLLLFLSSNVHAQGQAIFSVSPAFSGYGQTVTADFNGDGVPDLISSNGTVLLGKGDGTFSVGTPISPGTLIATADFQRRWQAGPSGGFFQHGHFRRATGQRRRHVPGSDRHQRCLALDLPDYRRLEWRRQTGRVGPAESLHGIGRLSWKRGRNVRRRRELRFRVLKESPLERSDFAVILSAAHTGVERKR